MKSDMVKTFEKINENRKLPKEIIEKIIKEVNNNFLMSISIMLYFILLIIVSVNFIKVGNEIYFKIFSLLLLSISIFFFEYGYKKDSGKIALYGVETLIVAIITLFLEYIIFELDFQQKKYYFMIGAYFAVYYMIKTIFICIIENRKYRLENIDSDIKDIVKKEERKYETRKTFIEDTDEANDKTEEIIEEQKKVKVKVEEKPKSKRGRPKKIFIEELKPVIDESKTIVTDKAEVKRGRGRPRKVVS